MTCKIIGYVDKRNPNQWVIDVLAVSICLIAPVLLLSACTTPQTARAIKPPAFMTEAVEKPEKPNAETATQKDVAVYLVELSGAIDLANFKLSAIKAWSDKWATQ